MASSFWPLGPMSRACRAANITPTSDSRKRCVRALIMCDLPQPPGPCRRTSCCSAPARLLPTPSTSV
eukprot:6364851-Amphidinium_carterae.1